MSKFLAFDLGAESGRAVLGDLQDDKIRLTETARFANKPQSINGHWHWDTRALFNAMLDGLAATARQHPDLLSLGCDSWGVDFVTLDSKDQLLGEPYCYRDSRTDGLLEQAFQRVPKNEIYEETGIQFMALNTLYQFLAVTLGHGPKWAEVRSCLMMADYFHFLFSGKKAAEISLASTSQAYNPRTKAWSQKLLGKFGVPDGVLPGIVPSGARLGTLLPSIAQKSGAPAGLQVIAPCSHDTGCAVAAVPAEGARWAYLSCGTWSLLGVELTEPLISAESRELGFTNEIGFNGTVRFLKNITGLWIVQECRRDWEERGEKHDYAALTRLAERAKPFGSIINPEDERFLKPGAMPEKIAVFCRETKQPVPASPGEVIRCALESLALEYRKALDQLEQVLKFRIEKLHIVGGGIQNTLLCQLTADAIGRPVIAGPAEATAAGNCLIQASALGHVKDFAHLRRIVRNSFALREYQPGQSQPQWVERYSAFRRLP